MREAVLVHLLDEVAKHLLRHVEVGDDAVLQRADGRDRPGRASEHPLRLDADRVHLAGALVDRDDRRLGEHDAAPADVDQRVGSAEIDRHVAAAEPGHRLEPAHGEPRSTFSVAEPMVPHEPLLGAVQGFLGVSLRASESPSGDEDDHDCPGVWSTTEVRDARGATRAERPGARRHSGSRPRFARRDARRGPGSHSRPRGPSTPRLPRTRPPCPRRRAER